MQSILRKRNIGVPENTTSFSRKQNARIEDRVRWSKQATEIVVRYNATQQLISGVYR